MPELYDVAVVGAGPTGQTLAILLAQQGHRVVMVDRHPEPYPLPRAVVFDSEAARGLAACGVADRFARFSEIGDDYVWLDAAGEPLLRFPMAPVGTSGWADANMMNQPVLESVLAERAAELPGLRVLRGVEASQVVEHRWEFMRMPRDGEDFNSDDTAWRLLARWGVTPENATLEKRALYTFQARWADRWRDGRLLIAGDAADGDEGYADDLLGRGLYVYVDAHAVGTRSWVLRPEQETLLATVGADLVPLTDGEPVDGVLAETSPALLPAMREVGYEVCVVRPDFYFFGGTKLPGLDDLLDDLAGHLKLKATQEAR